MPITQTFADGTTFTSTALELDELGGMLQDVLANLLGVNVATDADAYSKVRLAWKDQPAPVFGIDSVTIQLTEADDHYAIRRERRLAQRNDTTLDATYHSTRVWSIRLIFYGPNSYRRAHMMRTALRLPTVHDALAASNVYLVPAIPAPVRSPELISAQWWDRSDLALTAYEGVADTVTVAAMASAEVLVYDETGLQADIQASA